MSLASQLTQHVRIERPVVAEDGFGGRTVTWVELATIFAQIKPVFEASRERLAGGQRMANAGYRVVIRARTDVTAAMRIIWKNHLLLIHSLHEAGEVLNMLCYEEDL